MTRFGKSAAGWAQDDKLGVSGPAMLVIADDPRHAAAEAAVASAGGHVLGRIPWKDSSVRLAHQGAIQVVLAEARGVADAALAPSLPLLDALARTGDARIVVTLDFEQIDLVAASLTAPGIELLCAPSSGEHFTALHLAGLHSATNLLEIGREAEAARMQRLHEEVARIAETLTRLTRNDPTLRNDAYRPQALGEAGREYRVGPASDAAPGITAREVREAIRARRVRDQYFGVGLFEDPAWDMLLDLFAAELERAQVSVSSLCIAAAVAPTTALRWITRMTDAGLFERRPDPFDRRRAFMGLSTQASAGMRNYTAAVARTGVGLV